MIPVTTFTIGPKEYLVSVSGDSSRVAVESNTGTLRYTLGQILESAQTDTNREMVIFAKAVLYIVRNRRKWLGN